MLDTYKIDSLENTDKRLIRGLYLRKLKDYEEDGVIQNKMKLMSLIKGKAVTTRDVISPPPHLLWKNTDLKEYSNGILNIVNRSYKSLKLQNP